MAFDPGGSGAGRLASAGDDGTVRLWDLRIEELAKKGCSRSARNLSSPEWRQYFGDEDLRLTCPGRLVHPSFLEEGRDLASAGEVEQAISTFGEVLQRFGTSSVDPARLAGRYAAGAQVRKGDELARAGDVGAAQTHYRRAIELDPSWRLVPANRAAETASWAKKNAGDRLANQGDIAAAVAAYKEATDLYPTRSFDPLNRAHRLTATKIRIDSVRLAKKGELDQALVDYGRAGEWRVDLPTDPGIENELCWYGSLWDRAADVLPHCERAVAGNPQHGDYRDSRGVARALTGDLVGAADDFRAYLTWGLENGEFEELLTKRRQWIDALESGRSPFDCVTLKALRRDEM